MEVTGITLQTVAAGEDVAFTETAVNGTKCIVHRQGSGIIKLRGITNQCKARFLVSYSKHSDPDRRHSRRDFACNRG